MGLTARLNRHAAKIKAISIALIVLAVLLLMRTLPLAELTDALGRFVDGAGVWGPVIYGVIYVVATVLLVPGLVLTVAAGTIFGLLKGTIVVSLASTTGAAFAFLIARYLAREKVAKMAEKNATFSAVDRAIGEGGWKIVALLRLSPAIPFNLQNYLYGLTPVRFWTCVLTSWVAMLPGTFLYVYVGHLTGVVVGGERGGRTAGEWAALVVGLLATVAVTFYVTRLARQKLAEQTEIEEADETPAVEEAAPVRSGWPWDVTVAATVALLALSLSAWAQLNPGAVRGAVTGLLGPPRVELGESHAEGGSASFDHSTFDAILRSHVDADGWVDYPRLATDENELDVYVKDLATAPFDELGRDDKLALLINAYNAFTLRLILDHWPLDSIKDIPEAERWDAERFQLAGRTLSLNALEHEEIRPKFAEPRIHFALVCAAVGCPPLVPEAYTGARLEEQLERQARYVHKHRTWFGYNAEEEKAYLTSLYDWYGGDFEQVAGSVLAYAARYSPELEEALEAGVEPEVEFLPYDWKINDVANLRPR